MRCVVQGWGLGVQWQRQWLRQGGGECWIYSTRLEEYEAGQHNGCGTEALSGHWNSRQTLERTLVNNGDEINKHIPENLTGSNF